MTVLHLHYSYLNLNHLNLKYISGFNFCDHGINLSLPQVNLEMNAYHRDLLEKKTFTWLKHFAKHQNNYLRLTNDQCNREN